MFSKWIGIVPNIVYFILTVLVHHMLSFRMFDHKWLALLPATVWGFSAGAISGVVFLKMYMLLTFFVVLNVYFHRLLLEADRKKYWLLIAIFICTFLGFMTHYYYLLFACLVAIKATTKIKINIDIISQSETPVSENIIIYLGTNFVPEDSLKLIAENSEFKNHRYLYTADHRK